MPRYVTHITRTWVLRRLRRTTSFDTSAMTLSRWPSDLMARSLQPLDANICVAKACASAHQPSSSAASEATAERLAVSRGTGVSDVMSPVLAPSGLAGDDRNQREKAAFERCQRSTAQQQRHYRYGRDLYLDQIILFRGKTIYGNYKLSDPRLAASRMITIYTFSLTKLQPRGPLPQVV